MFQLCSKVLTFSRWIVTHALIPDSGSGSVHKFPPILSLRAPNGGRALQLRFFRWESNSLTRSSSHSAREENEEAPATQILADSFLPPSVVPCAVLLLETPSDLAKAVWFGLRQYSLCELAVCLGSNALVAIRLSLA